MSVFDEHFVQPDMFDDLNQWFRFIKKKAVYRCVEGKSNRYRLLDDMDCASCTHDCLCCEQGSMLWNGKVLAKLGATVYFKNWKGELEKNSTSTSACDIEWHYIPDMSEEAYSFLQFVIRKSGQNMFKNNGEWIWEPSEGFYIRFKDLDPKETYCCNPALSYERKACTSNLYVKTKKIIGGFYGVDNRDDSVV